MNKKSILLGTMIFVSIAFVLINIRVHEAEASGTIYIRHDGLVFPSNASIQREGDTYTLTDNINDSIVIQKNDVVIDGAEIYTLKGPGNYDSIGIELNERHNVTVKNFKGIEAFGYGILLNLSSNIIICGNTITSNNRGGIYLSEATNNSIYGNNMTLNMNYDIKLYQSSNNEIYRNNPRRILIEYSSNNNSIYENNIVVSGQEGIGLVWSANNNKIYGNHIRGGLYGIRASYASSQRIWGNNITDTTYGLYFSDSSNNIISRNTVKNTTTAIFLDSSSENTIFHNNFMDFEKDAYVFDSHINLWDIGYPVGGNYWSNYTGFDSDRDGIGESPHILDAENSDNYPLVGFFSSFNTSLGKQVNIISNSTIEDFEYFDSNSTIKIYVFNMTANQTFGFCRISIPHVLMSEPYNVTIDGDNPTYWNYTLYDNGTHRWIYFAYEHSTLKIMIVREYPSFLILPIFMIATLLAVIAYRRKHTI